MPYEFNGVYYSVKDLEKDTKRCYSILCRWIKGLGIPSVRIGNAILVDQSAHDSLVSYARELDELGSYLTPRMACDILGCQVDELTANDEIPCKFLRGEMRYLSKHIHQIREACKPSRGRINWANLSKIHWA